MRVERHGRNVTRTRRGQRGEQRQKEEEGDGGGKERGRVGVGWGGGEEGVKGLGDRAALRESNEEREHLVYLS